LQQVESIASGVLRHIHATAGAKVAVGTVIATIRVG
jgi:pyruvate/2-oxoglutarate dehydrogenase complex dihydrolipoamide acyltransferase (E2) component